MALENFTTYTETDPGADITVTATRATFTLMTEQIDAHVQIDKTADYFAGNFEIDLTVYRENEAGGGVYICSLANLIDDFNAIDTANGHVLSVLLRNAGAGGASYLQLMELDGGTQYTGSQYNIVQATIYYLTIKRDETVGTYGTFYLYIYSNVGRTTLLNTQTITLHTSKKDFRYLYALQSTGTGNQAENTGYVEAIEIISNVSNPTVTTEPCTNIAATTATGNGTITDLGSSSVTEHGHCWILKDSASPPTSPTTSNSKTTNGARGLGAFTSAITGLTPGLPYLVRAYATNSAGTGYGANVSFTAGFSGRQIIAGNLAVVDTELHYVGADGVEYYIQGVAF